MRKKPLLTLLAIGLLALSAAACGGSGGTASAGAKPTVKIAFFQGAVAGPDTLVVANPSLSGHVAATLKLQPIDSGVAGLSQLRAGAFPIISAVGNPPFVGAIVAGTDVRVVFVESQDSAGLVVNNKIANAQALAGRKVGVLVGSTLDFEFRGWLKAQGLTGKVTVAGFASEAAEAAAFTSGRLDATYVSQAVLPTLLQHGGHELVDAAQIARLGYAAVNLLAVTGPFIQQHPQIVQQLVCQFAKAQQLATGADAATYITPAARYLGVSATDAITATKGYPFVPAADEGAWLAGADGTAATGKLAQNFTLTGQFLVSQSRASAVPAASVIADHIDPAFWQKAQQKGVCA